MENKMRCTVSIPKEMRVLADITLGVFNYLGDRSSPVAPPPLRAVKLTYNETAEKIGKAFEEIKTEAFKHEPTKEVDLHEEQASHDYAIKKFKNYKSSLKLGMVFFILSNF